MCSLGDGCMASIPCIFEMSLILRLKKKKTLHLELVFVDFVRHHFMKFFSLISSTMFILFIDFVL